MILAFLAMILICFLMSVLFSFIPAGIIWAVWNFVVLAIWPNPARNWILADVPDSPGYLFYRFSF